VCDPEGARIVYMHGTPGEPDAPGRHRRLWRGWVGGRRDSPRLGAVRRRGSVRRVRPLPGNGCAAS
jgi:hypothetical protein